MCALVDLIYPILSWFICQNTLFLKMLYPKIKPGGSILGGLYFFKAFSGGGSIIQFTVYPTFKLHFSLMISRPQLSDGLATPLPPSKISLRRSVAPARSRKKQAMTGFEPPAPGSVATAVTHWAMPGLENFWNLANFVLLYTQFFTLHTDTVFTLHSHTVDYLTHTIFIFVCKEKL